MTTPKSNPQGRLAWLPSPWRYRVAGLKTVAVRRRNWVDATARHFFRLLRPNATVLFYPDPPKLNSVAYKMCALLGYRIVNDPSVGHDHFVYYSYATKATHPLPDTTWDPANVVNARCRDISKLRVEAVFGRVFGYELAVDPVSYEGPMVEKADLNAVKQGRLLEGPIDPDRVREGSVYERLVDTYTADGMAEAFRVPIYDGRIPIVTLTGRPLANQFGADMSYVRVVSPAEAFTATELKSLTEFADEMGMDYGELDVLRDVQNGRIYVVDANTTPHGPSVKLEGAELRRYFDAITSAFRDLLSRSRC